MSLGKYKKQHNLIASKTSGQHTLDNPEYNKAIKELYGKVIQILNGLNNSFCPSLSKEKFISLVKELIQENEYLADQYYNKYVKFKNESDEIFKLFEAAIKSNDDRYDNDLLLLDEDINIKIAEIDAELEREQQESVAKYKAAENTYVPKTKFLAYNKKINKDEYIKEITKINHNRINSNQSYINQANELSSINEQQQLRFKHSIESSIDKNVYDKSILLEEYNVKIADLNQELIDREKQYKYNISQKERLIIQNTIILNELITKIGNDYESRLRYAYIPYEIKTNKLFDKISEDGKLYTSIEEQVLNEFKARLQENDIEIESFREHHKSIHDKFVKELSEFKKTFNLAFQKQVNLYNKNISIATKKYSSSRQIEDKNIIKKLIADKKKYINEQNKIKNKNVKKIKAEYYRSEIEYIKKYEELRSKKSECEAIKSSAIKNINYEHAYFNEKINNEIKLISNEKEFFTTTDHYEEIKEIYTNRLKFEIENENIRYEINQKELEIYVSKVEIKYQKDKIKEEYEYNIKLSDADLKYQQESINNRIDYFNVKTMLEIQRENIVNEFEVLYANENMNFEQIKNNFYTNCDNIQYNIYKNNIELKYKLIDAEFKLQQNLSEIEKQHAKVLLNHEKTKTLNEKYLHENLLQIDLYENRLKVEKEMINDTYVYFKKSIENIINLEKQFHDYMCSLDEDMFVYNKKPILIALEYLRKIKLEILKNYFTNEYVIINSRLNFEKELKFKKQIDKTKTEYKEFEMNSNSRTEKTRQTIASYKKTITSSKEALNKYKKAIVVNRLNLSKKDKVQYITSKKEIEQAKENITLLKRQIKANKNSLYKLQTLSRKQNREKILKEKKLNVRYNKIQKNQNNDTKMYIKLLNYIAEQHDQIKKEIVNCGHYLAASKYNYQCTKETALKINQTNDELLLVAQNSFDLHYAKFIELSTKQYATQTEIYKKAYEKYTVELKNSLQIANKEYETNKTTIINAYNSNIETMKRKTKYAEKKLLLELKKINDTHNININEYKKAIKKINDKKEYELACHDENYKMFVEKYNKNNNEIVKRYLKNIEDIKATYNANILHFDNKYKQAQKRIKNQHINNETLNKNNVLSMTDEYNENIQKTDLKIIKIQQSEKKARAKHEQNKKINYKLYITSQKNTRKELNIQNKMLTKKLKTRVITLVKEFKKELKEQKD